MTSHTWCQLLVIALAILPVTLAGLRSGVQDDNAVQKTLDDFQIGTPRTNNQRAVLTRQSPNTDCIRCRPLGTTSTQSRKKRRQLGTSGADWLANRIPYPSEAPIRQVDGTAPLDTFTGKTYSKEIPTVSPSHSPYPSSSNAVSLASVRHDTGVSAPSRAAPAPSVAQQVDEQMYYETQINSFRNSILGNIFQRKPPTKKLLTPTRKPPTRSPPTRGKPVGKGGRTPTKAVGRQTTSRPSPSPTLEPTAMPTVPLTFPPNMDPWDRPVKLNLKEQNDRVMCVSVIDENNNETTEDAWARFREDYPRRDFCLLRPIPAPEDDLYVPGDFFLPEYADDKFIYGRVKRPRGDARRADDWYEICNLQQSKAKGLRKLILFIDKSGSMDTSVVKASLNLFVKTAQRNGFEIIEPRHRTDENYIAPCSKTRVY